MIRRGGVPSGVAGLIAIIPDGENDNITIEKEEDLDITTPEQASGA